MSSSDVRLYADKFSRKMFGEVQRGRRSQCSQLEGPGRYGGAKTFCSDIFNVNMRRYIKRL
jgi:hypothetical protein